jgi:hypothetical protein
MDHGAPPVTDGLAADRPVIFFADAGVAGSSGQTPSGRETAKLRAGRRTNLPELHNERHDPVDRARRRRKATLRLDKH